MDCVRYPLLLHLVLLYQVMPLLIRGDSQEKSDSVYHWHISRRSVLDIAFTLWCYKNRYRFSIYQVNGYGCYCGRGGDGIPLDEFDRCCFKHDCCYDKALHTSCWKGTSIYLKPNYSQCKLGRAECPEWSDPCSSDLCLCDKQFGECLAIATFHHKYSKYHHKLCSEPKQKCPQEEKINLEADTRK